MLSVGPQYLGTKILYQLIISKPGIGAEKQTRSPALLYF